MVPKSDDLILIVKICRDADPDSWTWWFHMCWLYGASAANAVAAALAALSALAAAKLLRWLNGQ